MGPEGSLTSSQEPSTGPYPKPYQCSDFRDLRNWLRLLALLLDTAIEKKRDPQELWTLGPLGVELYA
jgi:hypothetical protein